MRLIRNLLLRSAGSFPCGQGYGYCIQQRNFASFVHPNKYKYPKRSTLSFVSIPDNFGSYDTSCTRRSMTTAYTGEPGTGVDGLDKISYLPFETKLNNGDRVEIDPFREEDWVVGMELMNLIIREGRTWPFEEEFDSMDAYRGYFLSHAAFVVRALEQSGVDANGESYRAGDVLGCYYIKPNFPGRCSHICNGGFITAPQFRKMGVATIMGRSFIKIAKDLGYKSSYFNLVFKSNVASIRLWEALGFERVAVLENAARLVGVEGHDTAYGYRFDFESLPSDYKI